MFVGKYLEFRLFFIFGFGFILLSSDIHTWVNVLSEGLKVVFHDLGLSDEINQMIYIKTVWLAVLLSCCGKSVVLTKGFKNYFFWNCVAF